MKKYFGEYKATVIDSNDSENLNRVKIRVKGLMDGIPKDYLPWASYKSQTPGLKGGSSVKASKGSKVWVRFSDGDINDAYYTGGVIEEKADLSSNTKEGRYILYESPKKGITLTVDDNLGDIEIKTSKYNTTLNTMFDLFLSHNHLVGSMGSPTGAVSTGVPPITALDFKKGDL